MALRSANHDVSWICEDDRGRLDPAILARARDERRILITFDTDFGDLIFRDGLPPPAAVTLFRLPETLDWSQMGDIAVAALHAYTEWEGYFFVVEEQRIRARPLPPFG